MKEIQARTGNNKAILDNQISNGKHKNWIKSRRFIEA